MDIGWFQFVLKECVPVTWETSTVKYSNFILYTPYCQGNVFCYHIGVVSPFFMVFVLCPPTWRINTYTKAFAHMLWFFLTQYMCIGAGQRTF